MKFLFNYLIFAAATLGVFFPTMGGMRAYLSIALGSMLFLNFTQLRISQVRVNGWMEGRVIVCWLLLLPSIGFVLGKFLPDEFLVGLVLVAITPSAMATPVLTRLMGGNFELAVLLSVVTSLLAPFGYSGVSMLMGDSSAGGGSFVSVLLNVLQLILIPFVLSLLARLHKGVRVKIDTLGFLSKYILLFVVFSAVSMSSQRFREYDWQQILLVGSATLTLVLCAFGLGYLLGNNVRDKLATSVVLGQKNTGLCLWLVVNFFASPAALVVVLYIVIQHAVSGFMIVWFGSRGEQSS
jgi:predicted Na+-dependent transporter